MPKANPLDRDTLFDLYVNQGKSAAAVGAIVGASKAHVRKSLVKFGIELRSLVEAFAISPTHQKNAPRKGPESSMWTGGRKFNQGYVMLHRPDHPDADRYGYVFEHRLVGEAIIGRLLLKGEDAHHINEDRADNRPENIQVMSHSEHMKIHAIKRHKDRGGKFKKAVPA